ncbi:MAG: ATP-binding protein [Thermodesulfobacteriota bacterium]
MSEPQTMTIYLPALYAISGGCLFACLDGLFIWYRQTQNRLHMIFGLMAGLAFVFILLSIQIYQAQGSQEIIFWSKLKIGCSILLFGLFFWFCQLWNNKSQPRLLAILASGGLILLITNFSRDLPLLLDSLSGLRSITLPWGEVLTTAQGSLAPSGYLYWLLLILAFCLPLPHLFRQQNRPEKRREQLALGLCCLLFLLAGSNDVLVGSGNLNSIYLAEFAILFFFTTMSYSLSRQLRQALEAKNAALSQANEELEDQVRQRQDDLNINISALERVMAETERAGQTKDLFLARMSHRIRTPMNAIIGNVSLLMAGQPGKKLAGYLETILTSANRLLTVLNDIHDYFRLDANRLQIKEHAFNLSESMAETVSLLASSASRKGIDLKLRCDPALPQFTKGDPHRLSQVIINLAANAIKFTESGGVTIQLEPLGHDSEGSRIRFSVIDTGPGIPKGRQIEIFQPFHQLDGSLSRKAGGTGLGLAISRELVRLMGGKLSLDQAAKSGATFTFTLNLAMASPAEILLLQGEDHEYDPASPELYGCPILLVEDEEINLSLTSTILRGHKMEVTEAQTGQEAVDAFAPGRFQVILMDIEMPEMDGFGATAQIRAMEAKTPCHVEIIATTAHALQEVRDQCRAAGMDDFLAKPYEPAELLDAISRAVARATDTPSGRI